MRKQSQTLEARPAEYASQPEERSGICLLNSGVTTLPLVNIEKQMRVEPMATFDVATGR